LAIARLHYTFYRLKVKSKPNKPHDNKANFYRIPCMKFWLLHRAAQLPELYVFSGFHQAFSRIFLLLLDKNIANMVLESTIHVKKTA